MFANFGRALASYTAAHAGVTAAACAPAAVRADVLRRQRAAGAPTAADTAPAPAATSAPARNTAHAQQQHPGFRFSWNPTSRPPQPSRPTQPSRSTGEPRAAAAEQRLPQSSFNAAGKATDVRRSDDAEKRAQSHGKRPLHEEYSRERTKRGVVEQIICSSHACRHKWWCDGEELSCNDLLWGRSTAVAVEALQAQRRAFLALSSTARRAEMAQFITFGDGYVPVEGTAGWQPSLKETVYWVPLSSSGASRRMVCRDVFLTHFPCSESTLDRLLQRLRCH